MRVRVSQFEQLWTSAIIGALLAIAGSLVALTPSLALESHVANTSSPVLISPQYTARFNSAQYVFEWSPTDGASSYELRYAKANCEQLQHPTATQPSQSQDDPPSVEDTTPVDVRTATSTEPRYEIGELTDGAWCWQVRSIGGVHGVSEWSPPGVFHVDTVVPAVTSTYSASSQRLQGTVDEASTRLTLVLDGTVRTDVEVSVDEEPTAAGLFKWSLTVPALAAGDHVYRLQAVDAAGNETATEPRNFTTDLSTAEKATLLVAQKEMLPLVPVGPLVFIASPAPPPSDDADDSPLPIAASMETKKVPLREPTAFEELTVGHSHITDSPVQATTHGWTVFGVAWYWWGIGAAIASFAWLGVARAQLAARLSWIAAA